MIKNYILAFVLIFSSIALVAQSSSTIEASADEIEMYDDNSKIEAEFLKKQQKLSTKVFGDTLFYEDFNARIPAGWTIVNNNANSFQWEWNTVYRQGQFSTTRTEIKSTTAANGFMSLPSDAYNTPTPPTGRVPMDTYFESSTIFITPKPSVWVTYQQYVRYCCNASNRLVLQVSTDNFITFQEYDAIDGLAVNAGNTTDAVGGMTNVINISTAVANASQFKIRFYARDNGRYFWMIDDFAVIEGVENDLELTNPYLEFHDSIFDSNPFYSQIPYDLFPPLPFFSTIKNNGSNTLTNVELDIDVYHDAYPNGSAGLGLIYTNTTSTNPSTVVSSSVSDSVLNTFSSSPFFIATNLGDFRVNYLATSDSIDDNLSNETATLFFSTSDTIYSKDDNGLSGGTGAASYVRGGSAGGTAVGDRFATLYNVVSNTANGGTTMIPTSISYFVNTDLRNIGVEIVPKIWEYHEDSTVANSFVAEVASTFIPYTVTAADTNTLLTLKLDNGSAVTSGLTNGQYAVGWEVTSIAGGTTFEVYEDASSGELQEAVTTFWYPGHSPGWGWVRDLPAVRLNMANLPVSTGIGSNSLNTISDLSITPNPNKGLFRLSFESNRSVNYSLTLINAVGKTVYNETIIANGKYAQQLDFSDLAKGIYFLAIENEEGQMMKKVVIQ